MHLAVLASLMKLEGNIAPSYNWQTIVGLFDIHVDETVRPTDDILTSTDFKFWTPAYSVITGGCVYCVMSVKIISVFCLDYLSLLLNYSVKVFL